MGCRCNYGHGYCVCVDQQGTVLLLALIASVRILAGLARIGAALGLLAVALYALAVEIPPLHPLLAHSLRAAVLALPRGGMRATLAPTLTPAALRWTPRLTDAAAVATTCLVVSLLLLRGHRLIMAPARTIGPTSSTQIHRFAVGVRLALVLWLFGTTAAAALRAAGALRTVLSDHGHGQGSGAFVQAQASAGLHLQGAVGWALAALVMAAALVRVARHPGRTHQRRGTEGRRRATSIRPATRYTA